MCVYASPLLEKSRYRVGRRGNVIGNAAAAWIDRFFPIPEEERSKFHVHARPSNSLPANHIF